MEIKIGVIGLGYVGLPLAALFSKKYHVTGFDVNPCRVKEIRELRDSSEMLTAGELEEVFSRGFVCTSNKEDLRSCNFYVVAVPTPVTSTHIPDNHYLKGASTVVGEVIKRGDYVVYESTVYPGLTEEICIPIVERVSGLRLNTDFYAGYSPERINPGDKEHTVETVRKITSGSTPQAAEFIDSVYASVLKSGTFRAASIKVAEAAKVMENTQRDVNIAFMNEMAKIFGVLGLDTRAVIEAASSKWNFLRFEPGLVGGHCIGVDPYYLIQKSEEKKFSPNLIRAARNINETMGQYVVRAVLKCLKRNGGTAGGANILILGFTFKENCNDVRNTKVADLYEYFSEFTCNVTIYDPHANMDDVKSLYKIPVQNDFEEVRLKRYDAIVLAVKHSLFMELDLKELLKEKGVIYDIKGGLPKELVTERL